MAAHCDARYSSADGVMHEIFCSAPVGSGLITLHGDAGLPGVRALNLSLNTENVPVSAAAQLARRAKKNLPPDLLATGSLQGNFVVKEDPASPGGAEFQGRGQITDLRLQSVSNKVDLSPGSVPFVLASPSAHDPLKDTFARALRVEGLAAPDELHIEFGPFPLALGRAAPVQARGWVSRSGYGMLVRGEGEVSHTLRIASLLGLPAIKANVEGGAQMDLLVGGSWAANVVGTSSSFSGPMVTGNVQLHSLHAAVHGVNGPIEISSANVQLSRDEARIEKLNARAAGAHWSGSVSLPRACGTPGDCLVHFNLNTQEVALGALHEWLSSRPSRRRWYQVLTSTQAAPPSLLRNLRGQGKISASRFLIHDLVANRASATLDLEHGKLKISDCRAEMLGAKHRGDWQIDFAAGSPVYTGAGTLTEISMPQVSDAMHDSWISGTGSVTYQLTASGADATAFWQSLEGGLQFDLRDGVLSHIALATDEQPLRVRRWQGHAQLHDGKIEIEKGKLVSPAGVYEISGTASLGRVLDLKLAQAADTQATGAPSPVYSITGTVAEPRVALTPAPQTQAQLKAQ
jgi:hypothetical protein